MNMSLLMKIAKAFALSTMLSISFCPSYGQPTLEMIQKAGVISDALDSICIEGYNLYTAEYVNWVSTDSLLAHFRVEEIGRSIIWQPTSDTWCVVFTDRAVEKCLFEFRYDLENKEQTISLDSRPITEEERGMLEKKNLMLKNALEQYGDSLRYNPNYGRPNFDFVRIDANTTRMYILQGVERTGIIPFGNDFSFDFDNECNIKAFRRYHNSFIPIDFSQKEGTIHKCTHSHLKDNPYITPTDVATFLLYGHDLYGMNTFSVYSTALCCYFTYNATAHSIVPVEDEESMRQ